MKEQVLLIILSLALVGLTVSTLILIGRTPTTIVLPLRDWRCIEHEPDGCYEWRRLR